MPRQRIHHSRKTYDLPDDFPQRLVRFKEESGLSWAELNRRLDIHHETMRRWRDKGVRARPSMRNMMALLAAGELAGPGPPVRPTEAACDRRAYRLTGQLVPSARAGHGHNRAETQKRAAYIAVRWEDTALLYGKDCTIIEASLAAVPARD